jgi:hypothetical protein
MLMGFLSFQKNWRDVSQTLVICLFVLLLQSSSVATGDEGDSAFENDIRPVLVESCFRCHGDTKVGGELRVDSREALLTGGDSGPAIVPGSPESSLLVKAIQRHPDVSAMPPDKDKALRPEQVAAFENWIRDGAYWPATFKKFESVKHWAFEPLHITEPPRSSEFENAIDAFIRSKQRAVGSAHAPRADKVTLIRRATFDLTGLPPTPEEVEAFLQDNSPNAYAALINRLLESKEYGKHWARHWLDVVRYADTAGETADYPVPLAWRYRNYVIDAFNADKPYDQFIQEQVAGDVLAAQAAQTTREPYAEQVTATGYLAISRRFGFDSENYHHLTIQDTIDNLGQTVLGLSLGCARCHDHKFDPVSMQDYYGLYAIFDSSRYSFPGSEQKQKVRSMAPLLPPSEAITQWRAFDQRVASLAASLEKRQQPVPAAILRSLHDMDGDFEMQAPAAGGSNGVLVPPWLYQGKIAVTNAAQSPFKNLYARGKVGASISADAGPYRIAQSLYPRRNRNNCRVLSVNLDFRVDANSKATGAHHFWIGGNPNTPAFVAQITTESVTLHNGEKSAVVGKVAVGEWHNLQLHLNLTDGSIASSLAAGTYFNQAIHEMSASNQLEMIDFVVLESEREVPAPAIEFDNLGVQEDPIPLATTSLPKSEGLGQIINDAELTRQLNELTGMGGDFELQTEGEAPSSPWNPGPNSVVKIVTRAQSSFTDFFRKGELGVHMPNRGEYDGFGLTLLKKWTSEATSQLYATFDFRIADIAAGTDGSWRFYIGHGPGNSAAVELFFNGKQLFQRSGDTRDPVHAVSPGQWNQLQLILDLKSKTFKGSLRSTENTVPFEGAFASGWDGTIDYSFIDSYGHIAGVRPGIDVDNYEIREKAFEPLKQDDAAATEDAARREQVLTLKREIAESKARAQKDAEELNRLLVEGPFEMAYSVTEGTPHSVRIHLRGEPSQPGAEVPRGFIKILGNETLPPNTAGSGRLELSQWLTRTDNPLTARVMVNRIWQYHFGQGLVKTPNDFGVRGLPPTHSDLLDYLAAEFMHKAWSIKSIHRMIMLSETYQQASRLAPTQAASEAESREVQESNMQDLYTHFSRRRLSAEEIRDSILVISGELDEEPGRDHPFPSPISWGYTQHGPFSAVYDHNKRSIYLMTQRLKRHPFLALFDGADPNSSTADRLGTTVPTQALYFLNDPFIYAKSEAWARRLMTQYTTPPKRIEAAYATAFARTPTDTEQASASEFIEAYKTELATFATENLDVAALAGLLRTLIASNEFLHVD